MENQLTSIYIQSKIKDDESSFASSRTGSLKSTVVAPQTISVSLTIRWHNYLTEAAKPKKDKNHPIMKIFQKIIKSLKILKQGLKSKIYKHKDDTDDHTSTKKNKSISIDNKNNFDKTTS